MGLLDDYVRALQKAPMNDPMPFGVGGPAEPAVGPPQFVVNALNNAAKLAAIPGEVYQSKQPVTTEDMIKPAADMARTFAGMGTPFAETDAAGIFGGRLGTNAEQFENSLNAEDMLQNGALPREIHAATGWYRNPADQKWRFEIPDNKMKLTYFPNEEGTTANASVGAMVKHPELLTSAYPQLSRLNLRLTKDSSVPEGTGLFEHSMMDMPNGSQYLRGTISVNAPNPDVARSVLAHELQHGVQAIEGFQFGTNPQVLSNLIEEGLKRNPALLDNLLPNFGAGDVLSQSYPLYYKTAGETEARNVQNRLDWTPEKRATIAPWYSHDIPFINQYKIDPVTGMLKALRGK